MANTDLHIISFNVPYPPDYGGVIDVYHKLRALYAAGVRVHLHCYQYGRPEAPELNALCASVNYYPRSAMWKGFFSAQPFIVSTRNDASLLARLLEDDFPILFEGLHTCAILNRPELRNRLKMVRMHNNEAQYYGDMAKRETSWFKRMYFNIESGRLLRFEKMLQQADAVLCISSAETDHYSRSFKNVHYVPAFHGHNTVCGKTGKGAFVLYHGNLSVNENIEAALFLIESVFAHVDIPLTIAGAHPHERILKAVEKYSNITIIANPDHDQLQDLIEDAHIHFLPAFQQTGIKLKLLNALFNGRFCMVTRQMVEGTGLEPYCICIQHPDEAIEAVRTYMQQAFTEEDIAFRKSIMALFSDAQSVQQILQVMQERIP